MVIGVLAYNIVMNNEELEKSLLRVHEWIKSVDQKISIALVLEAGILVILLKPTYSFLMRIQPSQGVFITVLIISALVLFGMAIIKAIVALAPRLRPPKDTSSVLYFGSIAQIDLKSFSKKVRKMKSGDYTQDLTQQIHVSSTIARKKHRALADSLYLMVFSLIPWSIALLLMWTKIYAN